MGSTMCYNKIMQTYAYLHNMCGQRDVSGTYVCSRVVSCMYSMYTRLYPACGQCRIVRQEYDMSVP